MYRQGDVLITKITRADLPDITRVVERENGRLILAHGEATGHAHAVKDGKAELLERPGDTEEDARYLTVGRGGATVVHDEHDTIELPTGTYRIDRQREHVPPPPRQPGSQRRQAASTHRVWD